MTAKCNLAVIFLRDENKKTGNTISVLHNKGGFLMKNQANKSIECTVKQCAYHCDMENYCSLNKITVGTHEANPTMDQCTDCLSFMRK